jgi:hypothetical protein
MALLTHLFEDFIELNTFRFRTFQALGVAEV